MAEWTEEQEERIRRIVEPVLDVRYARIREKRLSVLEGQVEDLLDKSRKRSTESAQWRKEASLLREAIRRIKEAES